MYQGVHSLLSSPLPSFLPFLLKLAEQRKQKRKPTVWNPQGNTAITTSLDHQLPLAPCHPELVLTGSLKTRTVPFQGCSARSTVDSVAGGLDSCARTDKCGGTGAEQKASAINQLTDGILSSTSDKKWAQLCTGTKQ